MATKNNSYDVIVLGAGAAGLMAAATAGARGKKVVVVEKSNKPGKKILMSGGGRCNFTNLHIEPNCFVSQNPHFCKSALSRYTQWHFIELVESYGIAYHEKTLGQLFCDHSAKDILAMLLNECEDEGVTIKLQQEIVSIEYAGQYIVHCKQGTLKAPSLIVATGGLSIPKMGGSGFGYDLARQFGHELIAQRAGLVPLTISGELKSLTEQLSGLSVFSEVRVPDRFFQEALLFTHRGLSGPAILQLSNYWNVGNDIHVDLLPSLDLSAWLTQMKIEQPKKQVETLLQQHFPKALVAEFLKFYFSTLEKKPIGELPTALLKQIGQQFNDWRLKPAGTEGYRTAEVTLGGVNTNDLSSKTMESQLQSGLFFIGEVVDVTGHLGGFNFQWAWSSAVAAGLSV